MAYNVTGLNAQGPAAQGRVLSDSSHLGRQTAGENNPRLAPFDCWQFLLQIPLLKSNYVATALKVPFRKFLLLNRAFSFDVLRAALVAAKVVPLRNLIRNKPVVLCISSDADIPGEEKTSCGSLFQKFLSACQGDGDFVSRHACGARRSRRFSFNR